MGGRQCLRPQLGMEDVLRVTGLHVEPGLRPQESTPHRSGRTSRLTAPRFHLWSPFSYNMWGTSEPTVGYAKIVRLRSAAVIPARMARAMKLGVEAGRLAYLSGRMPRRETAAASSPLEGVVGRS